MVEVLNRLERGWQARKDATCLIAQSIQGQPPASDQLSCRPRSEPFKIDPFAARSDFGVDTLWRPRRYLCSSFVALGRGSVRDEATGLTWQQSGSPYPLSWRDAQDYIAGLNCDRFASQSGWRLPTAPELLSLLRPTPHGEDFCIEPVFDLRQRTLWSCDRRSFIAAWFVNIEMGFVSWQDMSARCFARAVCSV
jgi:eukaryotic-like serine/threonine-protein kinase